MQILNNCTYLQALYSCAMDSGRARAIAVPLALVVVMLLLRIRMRKRARSRRLAIVLACMRRRNREHWVDHRSTTWYDSFVRNEARWSDAKWERTFRVSRLLFNELCDVVGPLVQAEDTRFRLAIPAHKLLSCTLYFLAHGSRLHTLSELFAIGRSTLSTAIPKVLTAIRNHYYLDAIRFPTDPRELRKLQLKFESKGALPGAVGAIDCTHIEIVRPTGSNGGDYYNRKQTYSFNCQAVCDGDGSFLTISTGWPGAYHDARILGVSGLRDMVETKQWLVGDPIKVGGVLVKPYLLGDSGYPLYEWLLTPHPSDQLRNWRKFNYEHSRSRIVIEKTFGMLKRRFRILAKPITVMTERVNDIFIVCCVLHNLIAVDKGDVWEECSPPTSSDEDSDHEGPAPHIDSDQAGHALRNTIMRHLARNV